LGYVGNPDTGYWSAIACPRRPAARSVIATSRTLLLPDSPQRAVRADRAITGLRP